MVQSLPEPSSERGLNARMIRTRHRIHVCVHASLEHIEERVAHGELLGATESCIGLACNLDLLMGYTCVLKNVRHARGVHGHRLEHHAGWNGVRGSD